MKKLCILVPYRDREEHMKVFLKEMPKKLKDSKNIGDFLIAFIEQEEGKLFNRGKLLNIGFDIYKDEYDYFIFHDVDMIPDSIESYFFNEEQSIVHLATNATQFEEAKLPYDSYFGGITLFNKKEFNDINGFSNCYWGWGKEDDDLLMRAASKNKNIYRRQTFINSLEHKSNAVDDEGKPQQYFLDNESLFIKRIESRNFCSEGLSDLTYKIIERSSKKDHDIVKVSI